MGGSIAVVVRDWDGVIHKQGRWTNGLSTCFNDVRFFEGNRAFLKDYLTRESAYGPWNRVAPYGYGLVLADCQTKTLLDWQGYTAQLGGKIYEFAFAPRKWSDDEEPRVMHEEDREQAVAYFAAGRARYVQMVRFKTKGEDSWQVPVKTIEEVDDIARKSRGVGGGNRDSDECFRYLVCDISPWTHIRYEETTPGLRQMQQNIVDLGLPMTPADKAEWTKFIKQREDE